MYSHVCLGNTEVVNGAILPFCPLFFTYGRGIADLNHFVLKITNIILRSRCREWDFIP